MPRRSILSSVRKEPTPKSEQAATEPPELELKPASKVKPSRRAKLHIGGYYDPDNRTIIAFQKLGIDLRETQQEMLLEAIADFVAKKEASRAFQ